VLVVCSAVTELRDELITHWEESSRLCVCLIVCDLDTSRMRPTRPDLGYCAKENIYVQTAGTYFSHLTAYTRQL
jgi:hypothetical protein